MPKKKRNRTRALVLQFAVVYLFLGFAPVRATAEAPAGPGLEIWVTQNDVTTLANKLKRLALSEGEDEVLRRTMAGIVIIGSGSAGKTRKTRKALRGYTELDFSPLAKAVGKPRTSFNLGMPPTVSLVEPLGDLKLSNDDLISLTKKLKALKLSDPELEILRHIAACIRAHDKLSKVDGRPATSVVINHEEQVVINHEEQYVMLGPLQNELLLDESGRPLVGLFPSRS